SFELLRFHSNPSYLQKFSTPNDTQDFSTYHHIIHNESNNLKEETSYKDQKIKNKNKPTKECIDTVDNVDYDIKENNNNLKRPDPSSISISNGVSKTREAHNAEETHMESSTYNVSSDRQNENNDIVKATQNATSK